MACLHPEVAPVLHEKRFGCLGTHKKILRMTENFGLWRGALFKKSTTHPPRHQISPVTAVGHPFPLPDFLECEDRWEYAAVYNLSKLTSFKLYHDGRGDCTRQEWGKFLLFLFNYAKLAVIHLSGWDLLIQVPSSDFVSRGEAMVHCMMVGPPPSQSVLKIEPAIEPLPETAVESIPEPAVVPAVAISRAETHPKFLEGLSHQHTSWVFGAIAELVDNARDAKAKRLSISVVLVDLEGQQVPMLCVENDGCGMDDKEMKVMLSFGHGKSDDSADVDRVGRYGVGFKSGSMQVGRDALIFTRRGDKQSLGFLSISYNSGKEVLEVPRVTWRRQAGGGVVVDLTVQSALEAEGNLAAICEHSPFDREKIANEFAKIERGTRIFIYNLEKWGTEYKLDWGGDDIRIRRRKVRSRPGQTGDKVALDYSLRSYLEVLYMVPEMEILVNGVQVRTRRLDKLLPRPQVVTTNIMGAELTLTVGFSESEKELGNCGVFLYWHGRLIEAYKRVGGMCHSADMRGVIAVIDTTSLMTTKTWVGVNSTKQGFQDSVQYDELERWLAATCDKYWEDNFENDHHMLDDLNAPLEAKSNWVMCEKCRKWRRMPSGRSTSSPLPDQWFCYMPPFNGLCSNPEEKQGKEEWTTAVGRNNDRSKAGAVDSSPKRKGGRKISTGHKRLRTTSSVQK